MSSLFEIYVVDERKLSISGEGTDQERYERLVAEVREHGAQWHELELSPRSFARGLQAIDAHIGARKFLPIFAFNNSPGNVLGNDGERPDFGYFTPKAAQDLATLLSRVPAQVVERLEEACESAGRLYAAFLDAAEEALRRGGALAVLHDAPTLAELRDAAD